MTDIYSPDKRSHIMRENSSHHWDGGEELPEQFKHMGLHKHPKGIYGNPDFANKSRKIAVFIDGCFWHKCPTHYHEPKTNSDYWIPKIQGNVERDKDVMAKLEKDGWIVVRLWEHEL